MDLDFWDCFGRKKFHLITEEIRCISKMQADGIAISVQLDQAAPYGQSDLGLQCFLRPSLEVDSDLFRFKVW